MDANSQVVRDLAEAMADSYVKLVGTSIVHESNVSEAMYASDDLLLCHDGSEDPKFIYANLAAQSVFERSWQAFVGLPSRLSAGPEAQNERSDLIAQATSSGLFLGYSGVRTSSSGRSFVITDATLWKVTDASGTELGLACRIPSWHYV